jgi:hypothetical protein
VFNTAFGNWENLPFDMRHKRRPILFDASTELSEDDRRSVRFELAKSLEFALRTAQKNGLFESREEPTPEHHPVISVNDDGSSFLGPTETLGVTRANRLSGETEDIILRSGASIYMRLWPKFPITNIFSNTEIMDVVTTAQLRPMCGYGSGGWSYGRNRHGAFSYYDFRDTQNEAIGITQLFKTGEIWGVDTYLLNALAKSETRGHEKYIPTGAVEREIRFTLANYLDAARNHIQLTPPLELRIGMTQMEDYELAVGSRWFMGGFVGRIFESTFEDISVIESYDESVEDILLPFFERIYDMAGEVRPVTNK